MNRSLRYRLSRALILAIVLTGLLAGAVSFVFAYFDAQEYQDDILRQIVALTTTGAPGEHGALGVPQSADESVIDDPESRFTILRVSKHLHPGWLAGNTDGGFHTLVKDSVRMRVFVGKDDSGDMIVVTQPTEVRDEIALNSALRTIVPWLFLIPLLVWVAGRIIGGELAPVRDLAHLLDAQSPAELRPLPDTPLPDEIAPFIHAINRLMVRTNRLMDEQQRFIADAAHELRTPLTALSLQAQNLESVTAPEAMRERVAPLRAGIQRAQRLTEQLLSLARTQAGKATQERIDLAKLARDLIAEYLPIAEANDIDLGLESTGQPFVSAQSDSLRLIIKNALDNALRYTLPGGQVTLRLYPEEGEVVIEVIDTGPGIPLAERERVFSPFHRLDGTPGDGSGLGLAIVKDAAASAGGTVTLHDAPNGAGLLFRYRQPASPSPSPEKASLPDRA